MKKNLLIIVLSLLCIGAKAQTPKNDHNFDLSKNFEILHSMVKELDLFYVDSIKPQELIRKGMNAMLQTLDPYTNHITEADMKDFLFITTGEYGGVGSVIGYRSGSVFFSEPYEGKPAHKAGIKAGDVIVEVDGIPMQGVKTQEVSEKLKGQAGTIVKLKVSRPGKNEPLYFEIKREVISISSIGYSDEVGKNTGYIQISSFTDKTSTEFKEAFISLKEKHNIDKLIIDLRSNGGGIMEEAINIVNYFVPKGNEVVATKGKVKQWDRTYVTTQKPIDLTIPIVVLIDRGSASASEILAGALQDLDRAVIMGNRSFGKGLVQTTRPLPYNESIKLTTAKYYIPSGRCVQAIDYYKKNEKTNSDSTATDSVQAREFFTKNGRPVKDGGGVTPDIEIKEEEPTTILYYLLTENVIFDFATEYTLTHEKLETDAKNFSLNDQTYQNFIEFVKQKNFKYDQQSRIILDKLKEMAKFEGYFNGAEKEFQALEAKLNHDIENSLIQFRSMITPFIEQEIVKRYYFETGIISKSIQSDACVKQAIELLNNTQQMELILNPKTVKKSTIK